MICFSLETFDSFGHAAAEWRAVMRNRAVHSPILLFDTDGP
jgi:hypothetical protein